MTDFNSSLPIRTEAAGDAIIKICDPTTTTQQLAVDADGKIGVSALPADIDIRDLTADDVVTVKQDSGDIFEVHLTDSAVGDQKHIYDEAAGGVPSTPTTVIDYTVTTGKIFLIKSIQGAAGGRCKIELKTGPASSEVLQAVLFTSTSMPNGVAEFPSPIEVAAGDKILIIITNRDNANTDLYAFLNGTEVAA